MAEELNAGLADLADAGEREDLKPAGVGQNGPVPAHEAMDAAEALQLVGAGPKHEVIGVVEDDLGAGSGP